MRKLSYLERYFMRRGYHDKQLKIRIKEAKKSYYILLISIIIISSLLYIPVKVFNNNILAETSATIIFDNSVNQYKDSEIIIDISNICSNFDKEYTQIKCVRNFFNMFYVWDNSVHENMSLIQTPKQLINNGGVCRDASVFYKSIFELMGYRVKYIFEPEHVYINVTGENQNYIIDQESMNLEFK